MSPDVPRPPDQPAPSGGGLPGSLLTQLGGRLRAWIQRNPEAAERIAWWLEQATAPAVAEDADRGLAERMYRRVMPPNWWAMRVGMQRQARQTMSETGICLAWVPRASMVDKLAPSMSKEERDAVLVAHESEIVEDVATALSQATHAELAGLVGSADQAVEAFRVGLPRATQALCASLLGGILRDHFGYAKFKDAREAFKAQHPERVDFRIYRRASIQWSIRAAILRSDSSPPPEGFNRHLSAHAVDDKQFTTAHALAALLLIAGSLRELHEIYVIGERGLVDKDGSRSVSKNQVVGGGR